MANDYNILANHIVEKYISDISGTSLGERIVGIDPEKTVMVGMLAEGRVEKDFDGTYKENHERRFESVPSISLHFRVADKPDGCIEIFLQGLLFYTVMPEYNEVTEFFLKQYSENDQHDYHSIEELIKKYEDVRIDIPKVYHKIDLSQIFKNGIKVNLKEMTLGKGDFDELIGTTLRKYIEEHILSDIAIVRDMQISFVDLTSEAEFKKYCSASEEKVFPSWSFSLLSYILKNDGYYEISLQLVNNTTADVMGTHGYSPRLFNAGIGVKADKTSFLEIELDYLKKSYKERVPVYAVAENASSKFVAEENKILTENVPVYHQKRLVTNEKYKAYCDFSKLIEDPISNLEVLLKRMYQDYENRVKEFDSNESVLSKGAADKYKNDLQLYKMEIDRFGAGIKQIELKEYVKQAFKYMNMTFRQEMPIGKANKIKGWRLFQLVFIVSLIPEIIRSEYPDDTTIQEADIEVATLLFFPTGGGKTEAFLGVTVFNMFFDRLRGKMDGITSILRYPLRLLAVQQLERVLTVIMKANYVKQMSDDLSALNDFSVGFFVGKNNTPNKITETQSLSARADGTVKKNYILDSDEETLNEYYRFIDTCPMCGKKNVTIKFNYDRWTLSHICTNPECSINELPIYIVDNEIYRFLPTVLVSTIDKMAMSGTTNEFKMLFGQVKGKCDKHGFTCQSKCICGAKHSNCEIKPVGLLKDPIPTLFIQDELHLIKESLGTFDAHYESFINYYASELVPEQQRKQIRYIGATATISMYEEHIRNLYHMQARRFPCEYPSIKSGINFYSKTDNDDITRIILGYAPYGRSVTNGVWESVYRMRCITYRFRVNLDKTLHELRGKGFSGGKKELDEMLYEYWIELLYNNRKQDAMELENAFQNQANNYLAEKKIPLFVIEQMTSDVDFQTVRKTLFDIQSNHHNLESTNLILATSTISHGVDEDSFNIIYFFGMPNANAEYIQAYSRTGRKYTGIVIDIIRLLRVRDRSYLKNFVLFHQNKDDLVESVPINRWAKNAIYSSLPGILAALIYQYYTVKTGKDSLYRTWQVQELLNDGKIDISDVVDKIIGIYACNEQEKLSLSYDETIRKEVSEILQEIQNGVHSNDEFLSKGIGKYSHGKLEPMASLRDTEETIEISI